MTLIVRVMGWAMVCMALSTVIHGPALFFVAAGGGVIIGTLRS